MEILLGLSILGNIICSYLIYKIAGGKNPINLYQRRKEEIRPFISQATIKPQDAVELTEVDDELIRKSIKDTLANGFAETKDYDEPPSVYDNL